MNRGIVNTLGEWIESNLEVNVFTGSDQIGRRGLSHSEAGTSYDSHLWIAREIENSITSIGNTKIEKSTTLSDDQLAEVSVVLYARVRTTVLNHLATPRDLNFRAGGLRASGNHSHSTDIVQLEARQYTGIGLSQHMKPHRLPFPRHQVQAPLNIVGIARPVGLVQIGSAFN